MARRKVSLPRIAQLQLRLSAHSHSTRSLRRRSCKVIAGVVNAIMVYRKPLRLSGCSGIWNQCEMAFRQVRLKGTNIWTCAALTISKDGIGSDPRAKAPGLLIPSEVPLPTIHSRSEGRGDTARGCGKPWVAEEERLQAWRA
jgi:hypothetical protein